MIHNNEWVKRRVLVYIVLIDSVMKMTLCTVIQILVMKIDLLDWNS